MSERSGFFNAEIDSNGQYDRTYKAEQFAEYFSAFIGNGVYITPASQLKVIPVGNELAIYISVGNAYINGYFYTNDDKIYRKLSNPNGVNPRIDRVVLRLNFKTRKISVDILEGTAASNPSAKGITRSQDVYELALADVYIASNAITVTEANITDLRNNSLMCGYVKGVVDQIDTTNLFSQFQNSFDSWFANIKSQLSGDVAANMQRQIDENRERLSFNANKNNATNLKDTLESPMLVTNATVNLFSGTFANQTFEGITYTSNGDGTYSVKGSRTGNSSSYTNSILVNVQKGKTYKVLGSKSTNISVVSAYKKDNVTPITSSKGSAIFIADEDQVNLRLYVPADAEGFIDEILKPMLTTDLNATYDDFVPYSGYDIKTCGKNLLNPTLATTTKNGITCTNNGDGTYTLNGTAVGSYAEFQIYVGNNHVELNKEFRLTGCPNNTVAFMFIGESGNNWEVYGTDVGNGSNFKITTSYSYKRVVIEIEEGQTVDNVVFKPMITTDLSATYDDFEQYNDGGTVHIDPTTEFPLLGLKSFNGETNIISSGNVEVTYATSKSGKGFLESLLANSNIKDKLDAKIKENTNQINANKQQLTTVNGQITKLQQDQSSTKETVDTHTTTLNESVLPELNSLISNVAFIEQMMFNGVDNKLNLQIIQKGLFVTKGAMAGTSNTYLVGCVVRSLTGATLTTEPVMFASFDMSQMFQSSLITRAYFNKPPIALPGESAYARIQIMNEDLEAGARTVNVALVGAQSSNIQASVPFMINNLEIIAIRQTQSASQYSLRPASTNEISLMSLDDEVESDISAVNDEQFAYDEETLALMEKLDNDPNWTRIIFKN